MIPDIKKFKKRLKELNAKLLFSYEFTDYYYKPKNSKPWDPQIQSLRLRKWIIGRKNGSEILFTKDETIRKDGIIFKKSVYPGGKILLFKGSLDRCKRFLNDLGFEEWFKIIKKDCRVFKILEYNFEIVYEYIETLGWTGEIEIECFDLRKVADDLKKILSILKIPKNKISFKSLGRLYAERLGYIK